MHNDKEMIDRCLEGNPKAQEILYRRFAPRMYGVCLRYARNTLEADDILQEAFIRIFKFLPDYRFYGSLEGWIHRIVINTAINYYKSKVHEREEINIENAGNEEELSSNDMDTLTRDELLMMIQQLPEGYRMVFNLYVIEGFSHREIGNLLNVSESTSKSQLSRARAALQQKIRQQKLKS